MVLRSLFVLLLLLAGLPRPIISAVSSAPANEDQAASSADAAGRADLGVEESVLVTATRSEESLATASSSVTVFGQEQLEAAPSLAIDDVLRNAPGFTLFRRSSSLFAQPTTQGVSLRGIGPSGVSRTLVLLDGVPLNDPFGGWVTWSRTSLPNVERVEIVRGGGSSVWGSSALGGVIQLFSRTDLDTSVRTQLEVGERSSWQADLGLARQFEQWSLSAHANGRDYGGYRALRADQRGAIDVPVDSEHWQADGKAGWSSDHALVSLRVEHLDEERSNGTPLTDNSTQLDAATLLADFEAGTGSWSFRMFWQDQEFAARFSAQAADRSSERPALDQFLVASDRVGGSALWRHRVGSGDMQHSLVLGVDGRSTSGATNERFFFSGGDFLRQRRAGGDELLAGAFAQDTLSLGEALELQFGLRWDRWESSDGSRREFNRSDGSVRLEQLFEDRSEDALSPRLGLSAALSDRWRLRAAAYGAFRAPTINELFRPFRVGSDITAANAALEPEELLGGELGLSFAHSRGGALRSVRWDTTLFYNQLDDPIANVTIGMGPGLVGPCGFTPGGGSCRQRQNLDRTRVQGAETQLQLGLTRARISVGYQYSDATVEEALNAPELEGNRLAQVARHSGSIRLSGSLAQRWSGDVGVRFAGRQFEDDLNLRPLDEYVVVDLGVRFQLRDSLTLFAHAENVAGEEVEVARSGTGLVTIGAPRTLRLGLRWRLAD